MTQITGDGGSGKNNRHVVLMILDTVTRYRASRELILSMLINCRRKH